MARAAAILFNYFGFQNWRSAWEWMARRLAFLENVSLVVHDSPASVCLHYMRDTTSMHCCYFAITQVKQLYMNYEETVNYLEHLEVHFNGQCMNWYMYTYSSTLYTISDVCINNMLELTIDRRN